MNEKILYNFLKRLKKEGVINNDIYKELTDNYENLNILTNNLEYIKEIISLCKKHNIKKYY